MSDNMKAKVFLDTNILLYLFSEDEVYKREASMEALQKYYCITSTQAINELCNVFTRKWKLSPEAVFEAIGDIHKSCDIVTVSLKTVAKAVDIHYAYGHSYYDALMVAAAIQNNCHYLLSEDMHHNQIIYGTQIINIFKQER